MALRNGGYISPEDTMDIITRIAEELASQKHKNKSSKDIEAFLRKHLTPIADIKTRSRKPPESYTEGFEKFWEHYPRKDAKRAAFKVFYRKGEPVDQCIKALSWQTKQWNPGYIPLATTYLNQQRYEDEREICPAETVMSEAEMMSML